MKASDKIILGIYNYWPRLKDNILLDTDELAWLLLHESKDWRQDNGLRKIEYPALKGPNENHYLDKPLRDRNMIAKELSILQANDYIEFERPTGFDFKFNVQLLPNGLMRAEKLSTCLGRIELWYSENKNGILGLAFTILVSIITAWITSKIITKNG